MSRYSGTILVLVALNARPAAAGVRASIDHYKTGEAVVEVECFEPSARGKHPLILLLHGSGGLEQATGDLFRGIGRRLASKGYVALIPHYFESTNHNVGEPTRPGEVESWNQAVKDAIAFAAESGVVDPERIGLFGFSLGAYLAFYQAGRDPRIKAVASVSGSLPIGSRSTVPPTLVLHGSKDKGAPVTLVREFEAALKQQAIACEVHIYQGAGHNLDVPRFADAGRRAAAFFDKHVKGNGNKKR
jgi:dienelactone hydrolase